MVIFRNVKILYISQKYLTNLKRNWLTDRFDQVASQSGQRVAEEPLRPWKSLSSEAAHSQSQPIAVEAKGHV